VAGFRKTQVHKVAHTNQNPWNRNDLRGSELQNLMAYDVEYLCEYSPCILAPESDHLQRLQASIPPQDGSTSKGLDSYVHS